MEQIKLAGLELDFEKTGNGPPLLYLHSEHYFHLQAPFIERLAKQWTVYVPHHPGFDGRQPPSDFRRIEDLTYLYLDLIDHTGLEDITLLGSSFGGWIGLEMAVRNCSQLRAICLISPVGAKLGERDERDFADLWTFSETDSAALLFAEKAPNFDDFSADEMTATARDRQFVAYYAWKPYLHSLSLRRWLHRISVPTQLIWGDKDGFVSLEYGRKLAATIPGATLDVISNAGHYPQLEHTDETLAAFLAGPCADGAAKQGA
ncbi:MAG TPA: alpha/beta hydrolase [Rhodospirillaceae bacterium]|nr:alpha/beta hydrolase [Rhodospirillaceae bacterium]HAA91010.1 alpha/beta hydrolase [Rhodospirillaceae bacterium]HAT36421.1 alpha/beta hydrolase [Rhodospirillaceae bacterium]